jgi:hypothetical protein
MNKLRYQNATKAEVEYIPEQEYASKEREFLGHHRNLRYLIEKFVQLQPNSEQAFDKDSLTFLIALVDWLRVVYDASDSVQYNVSPLAVEITDDFLINVIYAPGVISNQDAFAEEQAKFRLGLIGNADDQVTSPTPFKDFVSALDSAFKQDVGFSFQNMVSALALLSHWPEYQGKAPVGSFYSADRTELVNVISSHLATTSRPEVEQILQFLTLKSEDVIRIDGQMEACKDIPVWEYSKRRARYTLMPLVHIEDKFFWGPYSARRSGMIWSDRPHDGRLPMKLPGPNIQKVLDDEKDAIERGVETKAEEIALRFTPFVRRRVELHKIDENGDHPQDLGDYDVLAYVDGAKALIAIECKDIFPAYCLKDAKRLREKIFGQPGMEGYAHRVKRRHEHLSKHAERIARALGWPTTDLTKIISVFVTRTAFWWTRFPPEELDIEFMPITMLSPFFSDFSNRNTKGPLLNA